MKSIFALEVGLSFYYMFGIAIMVDDHPYSSLWWMTTHILPKYNPLYD